MAGQAVTVSSQPFQSFSDAKGRGLHRGGDGVLLRCEPLGPTALKTKYPELGTSCLALSKALVALQGRHVLLLYF